MDNIIVAQVRQEASGELALFYWDHAIGKSWLTCFTFSEGHNEACDQYRLECKRVDIETAKAFAKKVETFYNTDKWCDCVIKVVSRLPYNSNNPYNKLYS